MPSQGWLEGTCNDLTGLFPAYKVHLLSGNPGGDASFARISGQMSELEELLLAGAADEIVDASQPAFRRPEHSPGGNGGEQQEGDDWNAVLNAFVAASPVASIGLPGVIDREFLEEDEMC